MDILMQIFPGIFTLFDDPLIGAVRVALILLGFVLAFREGLPMFAPMV